MRIGQIEHFCNCLLSNLKEHLVAADSEGRCVYCRHSVITREVKLSDITCEETHGEKLKKIKMEHLEILMKDLRHDSKVS